MIQIAYYLIDHVARKLDFWSWKCSLLLNVYLPGGNFYKIHWTLERAINGVRDGFVHADDDELGVKFVKMALVADDECAV